MQVNFNSSYTINQKTVDPKIVTSGYEWTKDYVDAYNAWYDYKSPPVTINGILPYTPAYLDSLKARETDPSLPLVTVDPATGKYLYYGSTNWFHELYRKNTPAYDNSISVSGSNNNASFYLSAGIITRVAFSGTIRMILKRYNLRMKGDVKLAPWFTLSNNTDFNNYRYFYPVVNGASPIWRYMDVASVPMGVMYNPDGTLTPSSYQAVGDMSTGNNYQITKQMYVRNTTSFNADIIKDVLNLRGDFTYAYTNNSIDAKYYPVTYSEGPGKVGASSNNKLTKAALVTAYYATNLYAEAKKRFGDHSFKVLGGVNIEDSRFDSTYTERDGLLDPSLPNINLLSGQNYVMGAGGYEWSIAGFFYRLNYAFKNKYLLESKRPVRWFFKIPFLLPVWIFPFCFCRLGNFKRTVHELCRQLARQSEDPRVCRQPG